MVRVKDLVIGSGMPKICVPIVEETQGRILEQAQEIVRVEALARDGGPGAPAVVDLIEWRADFYEDVWDYAKTAQTASMLQSVVGGMPLLFTFRTAAEGGQREISYENYEGLLLHMAKSGCVDLVDVEVFRGYDRVENRGGGWKYSDGCNRPVRDLIRGISGDAAVVGSYHDFERTPPREEILRRLLFMDRMGVAIPKIAVMPQEREDVICLMETTLLANRLIVDKPVITMAMGALGAVTRLAGETFGSAVTFGCLGRESAPGQIEVKKLSRAMQLLHLEGDAERCASSSGQDIGSEG